MPWPFCTTDACGSAAVTRPVGSSEAPASTMQTTCTRKTLFWPQVCFGSWTVTRARDVLSVLRVFSGTHAHSHFALHWRGCRSSSSCTPLQSMDTAVAQP